MKAKSEGARQEMAEADQVGANHEAYEKARGSK